VVNFPALPFVPQMGPADVAGFLTVFARASAFLFAAPLTGDKQLPIKVRAAAAFAIAVAVAPVRGPVDPAAIMLVLPADVAMGLTAGFIGRVVMAGAEAGGEIIGQTLGLGFAQTYDPTLNTQALPTQRIAVMLGALAFLGAGGLEAGVRVIAGPPVDGLTLAAAAASIIRLSGDVMLVGLRFAAPLLIGTTVANLAIALAARAAPAINAFSVALAAVVLIGGAVLYATAPQLIRETIATGRRAAETMQDAAGVSP
jgi:flagellar biosynthetic protein FliR